MWTIFEVDNVAVYNYQNYATSEFAAISALGALSATGIIVSTVTKPPEAKLSDVTGRAETYSIAVVLYIISYAMCVSSQTFGIYSGRYIIHCRGQTSMQILNQVLVANTASSRFRALANQLVNLTFMIVPWIGVLIVDGAIETVGWRWGIGHVCCGTTNLLLIHHCSNLVLPTPSTPIDKSESSQQAVFGLLLRN